jgi:hypothetical protein
VLHGALSRTILSFWPSGLAPPREERSNTLAPILEKAVRLGSRAHENSMLRAEEEQIREGILVGAFRARRILKEVVQEGYYLSLLTETNSRLANKSQLPLYKEYGESIRRSDQSVGAEKSVYGKFLNILSSYLLIL